MNKETQYKVKDIKSVDDLEKVIRSFQCLSEDSLRDWRIIREFFQSQREDLLKEIEYDLLELIAYSSFDVTYGGEIKDRNCTVEEAMSQLSKDVKELLRNK